MWRTYTIEPEAVGRSWSEFQLFASTVGWDKGRVMYLLPGKSWIRSVYEQIERLPLTDRQRKVAEVWLSLARGMPKATVEKKETARWSDAALELQRKVPIDAIVARSGISGHDGVLCVADIGEDNPLWCAPRSRLVRRSAEELAECIHLLLECSPSVEIIDPYFDPLKAHVSRVLERYLEAATPRDGRSMRMTVNLSAGCIDVDVDEYERRVVRKLSSMLARGQSVRMRVWGDPIAGERFHDRFLVGEHGGVAFMGGLDAGTSSETTTVAIVDRHHCDRIIRMFNESSGTFRLIRAFDVR